jgi:hypothetical protein
MLMLLFYNPLVTRRFGAPFPKQSSWLSITVGAMKTPRNWIFERSLGE